MIAGAGGCCLRGGGEVEGLLGALARGWPEPTPAPPSFSFPLSQVVILSGVLACAATTGYDSAQGLQDSPVVAFNGSPIRSLPHLSQLLAACSDPFLRFTLEAGDKVVVLDAALAAECTAQVMEDQNISSPMSKDLAAVAGDGAHAALA